MNNKKSKILIDVDDVIVDGAFLDAINKFKGTNYTEDEFTTYFFDEEVFNNDELKEYRKFLVSYDLYENCRLMQGVKEIMPILNRCMDVYLCSSCIVKGLEEKSGIFFKRKYDFLYRAFPYIDPHKYIFTTSKNNFKGVDFQVDDLLSNLQGEVTNRKILFTRHHNKDIPFEELRKKRITRVNDWYELLYHIYYRDIHASSYEFWKDESKNVFELTKDVI